MLQASDQPHAPGVPACFAGVGSSWNASLLRPGGCGPRAGVQHIPWPTFFRIGGGPPFLPPQRTVTAQLMQTFPPHLERKAHLSQFQRGLLAAHATYVVD
eukprot:153758-Hanusia_phi.AAC.1